MPKHQVHLNEQQRQQLLDLTSKGKVAVRQFKRSQILLLSDAGDKDQEIAQRVGVGVATVERTRQKFVEHGLDEAITEQPRPGRQRKLDSSTEAFLIATACSEAPAGRAEWMMQLLADRLVALGKVEAISDETVRRTLKKTSSSRG
ncbi:MAG TPA: helix-turn-helix domain-containing protein [Candidatus Caenarcaniphilales bacterium]